MARYTLSARIRNDKGKEAAKRLRKNNQIPAVFYGPDADTVMLAVDSRDLDRIIKQASSENFILGLQIESDKGSDSKTVMIKELQEDPFNDTFLHADFYEISMDREITVDIPIHLINTPEGVINGGILQHIRREITVFCMPDKLIEHVDVDVAGLDIGGSIHINDIDLPEGIRTTQEGHLTVAIVTAPAIIPEVEEIEELEVEGEKEVEEEGTDTEEQSVKDKKDKKKGGEI